MSARNWWVRRVPESEMDDAHYTWQVEVEAPYEAAEGAHRDRRVAVSCALACLVAMGVAPRGLCGTCGEAACPGSPCVEYDQHVAASAPAPTVKEKGDPSKKTPRGPGSSLPKERS